MADGYISQITLPNSTTFDLRDPHLKLYTGTCSTAAGTAIKNVVTDGAFTLEKGAVLFVNFTATNSAAVGDLKLKINGETDANAKPIKYLVNANGPANIPGVGYLRENQTYMFRYDGTNWVADLNYYTYSNDFANKIGHYNNILARKAITAESLIVGDSTGYEKVAANVTFDLAYPIVWCTAAVNANASNYNAMFLQHYDRNIATGAKSGFTSSANKVIYLIVTINNNIATIDSDIITDTIPAVENGKVYIVLGKLGAQSTGANYFFLYPEHKMFWYKDGAVRVYSGLNTYNVKDLVPITSKTYTTKLYNSPSAGDNYFQTVFSVTPDVYDAIWRVRYRLTFTVPGHNDYNAIYDCSISGRSQNLQSYHCYNSVVTYPIYYHIFYRGSSLDYPHEIGFRIADSYGHTTIQKNVKVDIIEMVNCTTTFFDEVKSYRNETITGYVRSDISATSNGLQETGDNDTTGRDYSHSGYLTNGPDFRLPPQSLFGFDINQKAQAFSLYSADYTSSTTNLNTARVYNTVGFVWEKGLWFSNSWTNYAKDANLNFSPAEFYYATDLRYTDNVYLHKTNTSELGLVARKPVYFRGTIGQDGLFYLAPITVTHSNTNYQRAWTQDIPISEDNYVYWLIGYAYYNSSYEASGYQVNLVTENKLYWYHNGRFQEYLPNAVKADSAPLSGITDADDLKAIEALSGTTGLLKKTAENTWTLDNSNYVTSSGITSVTIGATSPVVSSTSTAQTGSSASTTISLANNYGDTKNPYASKTKNYVLAAPNGSNGVPSFRALVAADLPSHTHYELATIADKRSEDTTPNTYANRLIFQGLKTNTVINSPYTDTYSYLLGLRGWSDSSGGNSHELAFNTNGIYRRQGATTTWGDWYHILDSGNTTSPNSVPTLSWGADSTVFTLNGTAVKVKAMAKPTYAFADLTAHPTTLSGYGITDAASSSHSHTLKIGNKSLSVSTSEQTWEVHDILYNPNNNIGTSTSWDITEPGVYSVAASSAFTGDQHPSSNGNQSAPYTYGHAFTIRAGNGGASQFYINHNASDAKHSSRGIRYRSGWNVINNSDANHWKPWATILDDKNYNLYSPKLDGTGATGSWGISITGNASGTASNITGTLALANFTKGSANTALMGQGDSSNPSYVSVSPSISITDGTSTAAPKINLTVLGISGTAQDLTIASTSAYGVTKLYDGVNSSSTEMAATAKAVKTAYDKAVNIIAESNALVYKGTRDGNSSSSSGGAYTPAANCGDVYIVSTAGYINGLYVELGDMLICNTDETVEATSSNYTTVRNKWDIIQTSNGTVSTSETSVAEGEIPVFKGTTGRFIQNSEKSFTVNAPTSSSGDSTIPTSKAVWTTVNTAITGLDVTAVGGGTGEYVSKISETDGKISATISTTSVSNTWTAGTTAGPTIKTTVNGITGTAVAIPSASNTASGIVTTGNQTFAGIKTFANTTASTSTDSGAVLVSGGLGVTGQVTATRLAANGSNTSYNLYVNGTSLLDGNTTVNGNLVPGANNTKTLGSTDAKWSKLYVGSSESYGNAYQPVYWNNGVPAVSYPVQYSTWSISSGDNTATLTGTDIFTADTYVISLVVTSGEQYLNGPITWTSAANTLTLSTADTSGDVEGYVLTSIGTATGATCASSSVTT